MFPLHLEIGNLQLADFRLKKVVFNLWQLSLTGIIEPNLTLWNINPDDSLVRLKYTINHTDEATPRSKAKPAGVHGCEIWTKIDGSAPMDASELDYLATNTSSPYTVTFEGKNAAKNVYYWLRWVNTPVEPGPCSRGISAMVAG